MFGTLGCLEMVFLPRQSARCPESSESSPDNKLRNQWILGVQYEDSDALRSQG